VVSADSQRPRLTVVPPPPGPVRVETHGPTLAWARCPDVGTDPPPLEDLDGRRVDFGEWEVAPDVFVCMRGRRTPPPRDLCDRCGYDGQPWVSAGTVFPRPGETAIRAGRKVPAPPVRRIWARRCPACAACVVYDMGVTGTRFDVLVDSVGQGTLF
jgi:hypothetical protein